MTDPAYKAALAQALEAFKHLPHLEVEFRLGRIMRGRFAAGVTREQFDRIERHLGSNPKWSSVTKEEFIDVSGKKMHTRTRKYPNKDSETVLKKKLKVIDIPTRAALDIRCSISQEIPIEDIEETPFQAVKFRTQRSHKFWSFDTTRVVRGASTDRDSDYKEEFQVEVELADVSQISKTSAAYIADYGLLLSQDLLKMIA
jgi:hypothetical protein